MIYTKLTTLKPILLYAFLMNEAETGFTKALWKEYCQFATIHLKIK